MRLPGCTDSVMPNDKSKGNKRNRRGPVWVPSWCFHQLCTARGRCWLMLYTQLSRLHFLAFQVADSSEWHVELFARNSVPHKHSASAHTARARERARTHTHTSLCCFQVLSAYGSNDDYILNDFSYGFSIFVATTRIIRCYNKPTWVFSHYGCYSFWHTGTEQH